MKLEDYLLDEVKRLNRMNDLIEKHINQNSNINLALYEEIQKNTSTMCNIAEVFTIN